MPRTIMMGDPLYFSVKGGANPHTRNILGLKKRVDPERARRQWHTMARTLLAYGTEVLVVEPHELSPGLGYPPNAGFLYRLEGIPAGRKEVHLANCVPPRAPGR